VIRRWIPATFVLAACSDTTPGRPSACPGAECRIPTSLTFAATLDPPPDTDLTATEFPPDELVQDADGVVQLTFPESTVATVSVHAVMDPTTLVAADVLLARPSRIPGQPDVGETAAATPEGPAVARIHLGASYDVTVLPARPADEIYLPWAVEDVSLDSGALDVPLEAPTETIEVDLPVPPGLELDVRLQGVRETDGQLTTVARGGAADEFVMRAREVAGTWTIAAEVAFVDPVDEKADLPNLKLVIEALLDCPETACAVDLPAVPQSAVPTPRAFTLSIVGEDAGGEQVGVPGVFVDLRSAISVPGFERVEIAAAAVTQADGTASVWLLDDRSYDVTLRAGGSGFASQVTRISLPADAPGDRATLRLDLGPRLSGTVVAAHPVGDEAGVAGAVVMLLPSLGGGSAIGPLTTDDQGAFAARVDPGEYDIDVTPPEESGYPRWSLDNVDVTQEVSGLQVVVPQGVSIPVRVVAGTEPVAGATVRILTLPDTKGRAARERAQATTDADGQGSLLLPNP
jgi:hypothetical protein